MNFFQFPPYTYITHENETSVLTGGIEVELLNALKEYFHFQYDVVDCNQVWGSYVNKTWTGLIGKISDNVSE